MEVAVLASCGGYDDYMKESKESLEDSSCPIISTLWLLYFVRAMWTHSPKIGHSVYFCFSNVFIL